MIRIVFVDDEINLLHGMRRALHPMRDEWDMDFVQSGAAALLMLEDKPADVIIADLRMPDMDGWELFAAVKNRFPRVARFILSGHADPGCIIRSIGTAHQYLAKPCESAAIKAAIQQTQRVRCLLDSEYLAALVGRVGMLPSAPQTFQRLLACLRRPDASTADVARVIERDVGMTANIMKLVNSAFFGSRQSIHTLNRAVAYLGLDTVGSLVLSHGIFHCGELPPAAGLTHEQLWQHSVQTAAAARIIALQEHFSIAKAEEAFMAGMLHDIGKMVVVVPADEARAMPAPGQEAAQASSQHAAVGAYLLALWGFPASIVEAVAHHHAPSRAAAAEFGLAGIIHIASRLAHGCESDDTFGPEEGFLEAHGLVSHMPLWTTAVNASRAASPA